MKWRGVRLENWLARRASGTTRGEHEDLLARHHADAHELASLRERFEELSTRHHEVDDVANRYLRNPFLTWRPPGHFYSAIPDLEDLRARAFDTRVPNDPEVAGVDLRPDAQLARFAEIEPLIDMELVAEGGHTENRFQQPNGSFDFFDAAVCSGMLRELRPKNVIEVGSGHSSALLLDLVDRHLPDMSVTCIEPYPESLRSVLRPADRVTVLEHPVQDVPLSVFEVLGEGDVLFIDSTHVAKAGSDVVDLFGRVIPTLPRGVVVHVHDIFHPFDYPWGWLEEGRAWNEAYVLRALLSVGSDFEVLFFNNWFGRFHADRIADERLASVAQNSGSIWLRRRSLSST